MVCSTDWHYAGIFKAVVEINFSVAILLMVDANRTAVQSVL